MRRIKTCILGKKILFHLVQLKLVKRSFRKRENSKSLIQRFMDDMGWTTFMQMKWLVVPFWGINWFTLYLLLLAWSKDGIIKLISKERYIFVRNSVWLGLNYSFSRTGINLIFLHFENCIPCISRIKLIICNSKIRLFPPKELQKCKILKLSVYFIDLN